MYSFMYIGILLCFVPDAQLITNIHIRVIEDNCYLLIFIAVKYSIYLINFDRCLDFFQFELL